ncbi:universal stress protein [Pseudorhodoplanes sp.]|jgi:nucleotide-binding universal stress UspA family protein|uniref:universal stress protein n=1 Tax=Pseudorhodoplanes sp. TaxID=1934341 RepID=UPI003D0E3175
MKRIVASTDFSTRSNRALRQAGLLAQPIGAQLHVLHVVDDDQPDELIALEKREAERIIDEQLRSMPELQNVRAQALVKTGNPFDGILKTAIEIDADLVVMGSHRKRQLLDIFVGTTIERVIRKAAFPVLMVNNEAQRQYERVMAPVDMTDISANALRVAVASGLIGDAGATLVHAFVALARGKMFIANADKSDINRYVASERQRAIDELAAFLVTNNFNTRQWSLRVEEGDPSEVISRSVSAITPDLLVMGTQGRTGFLKLLIGSVTEEALRSLSVDILTVPPPR